MLVYDLQNRGETPLYEYLYNCIRDDIRSGRLVAGSKLPSKRELAAVNGVALITAENAYSQLVVEGYVEAYERRGFYVADIEFLNSEDTAPALSKNESDSACTEKAMSNNSSANNTEIYDFTAISPADDSFPYNTWTRIMRRILTDREQDFVKAPQPEGIYELRKAIADYLYDSKHLEVNPDCIIVGPGTEYLHSIILQLIGRNRFVAVEDPGYRKASQIYESNGLKVLHIPMDNEGIDVEALWNSNVKLVHTAPAHQFPTGIVMSVARRHKLLQWAKTQNAYVIEDDYDSEFRFKGRPLPTLAGLSPERVIYMNTFSGTLAHSIRMAYMVLPNELMERYHEKLSFLSGTVSTFEQQTLAAFISEGYYERHISRMRNHYRKIREVYMSALKRSKLSGIASFHEDAAGLQRILDFNREEAKAHACRHGQPVTDDLLESIKRRGIIVSSVEEYGYERSGRFCRQYIMRLKSFEADVLVNVFNMIFECAMNTDKLEKNIIDMLSEQQLKLGYMSETVRLYYIENSLRRLLGISDNDDVDEALKGFCEYEETRMGHMDVIHSEGRYCFVFSPEVSEYVHEHMGEQEFLAELIAMINKRSSIFEVIDLFRRYSEKVHVEKKENEDFDYLVYFEDNVPDHMWYCLTDEGNHVTYHRYLKEDYMEIFGTVVD